MKRIIIAACISSLFLTACEQKKKEPEFITPRDQYGARYSVGDLGGKPVNLGREANLKFRPLDFICVTPMDWF